MVLESEMLYRLGLQETVEVTHNLNSLGFFFNKLNLFIEVVGMDIDTSLQSDACK